MLKVAHVGVFVYKFDVTGERITANNAKSLNLTSPGQRQPSRPQPTSRKKWHTLPPAKMAIKQPPRTNEKVTLGKIKSAMHIINVLCESTFQVVGGWTEYFLK